jgi:hypothetical protein
MAAALVALALGAPALAQTADTLVERYTPLAGSERNAGALVTGLRDGTKITLGSGASATTIAPPTQKMGFGNVDNALALTEASLRQQGIGEPTPEQLKTALTSVLQSRADGKGWGEIANAMGFRLGDLKRAERAPERVARAARPERPEKVERPQRPERPERPVKPERPGR